RLQDAVARVRPRLLLLDPLVRLHQLDENSSQEVSNLLGYLRALQREHDLAVALVHHTSKRAHARHGQALRGSGDLHAWTDVGPQGAAGTERGTTRLPGETDLGGGACRGRDNRADGAPKAQERPRRSPRRGLSLSGTHVSDTGVFPPTPGSGAEPQPSSRPSM